MGIKWWIRGAEPCRRGALGYTPQAQGLTGRHKNFL